jgi:hypothetical protein
MFVLCVGGANFTSNSTAAMATPNLSLLLSANGLPWRGVQLNLLFFPSFVVKNRVDGALVERSETGCCCYGLRVAACLQVLLWAPPRRAPPRCSAHRCGDGAAGGGALPATYELPVWF